MKSIVNLSPTQTMLSFVVAVLCGCSQESAAPTAANATTAADVSKMVSEIASLQAEVHRLQLENAALKVTPSVLLAEVTAAVAAGDLEKGEMALARLTERFSTAPEAVVGAQAITGLKAHHVAEAERAKKAAAQGFKAISVNPVYSDGDQTIALSAAVLGREWKFDAYGDSWHYLAAERGNQYVSVRATIATKSKSPELFGVAVYAQDGANLKKLGDFVYRFARWDDYGSYLGNEPDYGNDFARTSKIPFSLGVEVGEDDLKKKPLYIVAAKESCHTRHYQRFHQPPESYIPGRCVTLKDTLVVADFMGGTVGVLKKIE